MFSCTRFIGLELEIDDDAGTEVEGRGRGGVLNEGSAG